MTEILDFLQQSRQISLWGVRQTEWLSRRIQNPENRQTGSLLIALLLRALERGVASADIEFLLNPLLPHVIQSQKENIPDSDRLFSPTLYHKSKEQLEKISESPADWAPIIGLPNQQALIIYDPDHQQFAFSRHWNALRQVETQLSQRLQRLPTLQEQDKDHLQQILTQLFLIHSPLPQGQRFHERQLAACILALRTRFLIISGGPGTGKTSVVVQILRALLLANSALNLNQIVLCAPTGRAKARLGEGLPQELSTIEQHTLHSLLRQRPDGSFAFHRDNPLPYQVVVLDEASMVDVHLFAGLLDALSLDSHLILLGDMHQLPSVDAGAVLGDLTQAFEQSEIQGTLSEQTHQDIKGLLSSLPSQSYTLGIHSLQADTAIIDSNYPLMDHVILLDHSYRSSPDIQNLCHLMNQGQADKALTMIQQDVGNHIALYSEYTPEQESTFLKQWFEHQHLETLQTIRNLPCSSLPNDPRWDLAWKTIHQSRILVISHHGRKGRLNLNQLAEKILRPQLDPDSKGQWFHGQMVILDKNHHDLNLYNGDLGIIVDTADAGLQALFQRGNQYIHEYPERLSGLEPAYAMTVHKSQGSEFEKILLVLPEQAGPLLHRQILYTALTRAKQFAGILGHEKLFLQGISQKEYRPGGLRLLHPST